MDNSCLRLFLVRPPLRPGESLLSWILHLAEENGVAISSFRRVLTQNTPDTVSIYGRLAYPADLEILRRLHQLTGVPLADLYNTTAHRFAPVLVPPGEDLLFFDGPDGVPWPQFTRAQALYHLRSELSAQFCPHCLRTAAYHRLVWLVAPLTVCEEHACLLVERCPGCQKRTRIADLVSGTCHSCNADLRAAPAQAVDGDTAGLVAQATLRSWLLAGTSPRDSRKTLPVQPVRSLFRVLDGLRSVTSQVRPEWSADPCPIPLLTPSTPKKHRSELPTPAENYRYVRTAFQALQQWPVGFHTFLDAYRHRPDLPNHAHQTTITRELDILLPRWLDDGWRDPALAFVQTAFDDYFIDHYGQYRMAMFQKRYLDNPQVMERWPYLSLGEASRILGCNSPKIHRFFERGDLTEYRAVDEPDFRLARRDEVVAWGASLKTGLPLKGAARRLGTDYPGIRALVDAGYLHPARHSQQRRIRWHFPVADLDAFAASLSPWVPQVPVPPEPGEWIRWGQAVQRAPSLHQGTVDLMAKILDGTLPACRVTTGPLRLKEMWVRGGTGKRRPALIPLQPGWMGRGEVCAYLGVSEHYVRLWTRRGILVPVRTGRLSHYFYDRGAIEAFGAQRMVPDEARGMTLDEAAAFLDMAVVTLWDWLRQGRLQEYLLPGEPGDPSPRRRLDRDGLLAWRTEHLTYREVMDLLGISVSTFLIWTTEGRIVPAPGWESVPRRYSRRAVAEMQRQQANQRPDGIDRLSTLDAAALLGVCQDTIEKWAKAGILPGQLVPRKGGPRGWLFERAALVQWRAERLTIKDAQDLLGLRRTRLRMLLMAHGITPLPEMGRCPSWYARAAILALATAEGLAMTPAPEEPTEGADRAGDDGRPL